MNIDVAIALVIGSICGVIATMFIIGVAFAWQNYKESKKGGK